MKQIDDCRKKASLFELSAHLTACLSLFIFKTESRNGYNQYREDLQFRENYEKLFGFPMPHGDSMNNVIVLLDTDQIEQLKQQLIKKLLERKIFHKNRYRGKWFRIAIDGSGVVSFDYEHSDQCLHKTSKNGKKHWSYMVLDARLVTPNGFSLSLATVWIENPEGGEYDKQDCERKAFQRLAKKLKKAFPRLPIIILADGLYPYEGFFITCKENQWAFHVTFKEGCLPTVWDEVIGLGSLQTQNHFTETRYSANEKITQQDYQWVTKIDYKGYLINWIACDETITSIKKNEKYEEEEKIEKSRFVHITDLPLHQKNVVKSSQTGRLRWKIENEGFNTLKNGGYGMKHKWTRKSDQGLKNYYQFMQMGYLITQLMIKSVTFVSNFLQGKNHPTLKSLWKHLIAAMEWTEITLKCLKEIQETPKQIRFIT